MKLVAADFVSDEDVAIQHLLNSNPVLKYRLAFLLSSYRELCTLAFENMQQGKTDTADGWISLSKKDTVAKRLGIPLFEGMQDWMEARLHLEELREEADECMQWRGLRDALNFHHDIERVRGKFSKLIGNKDDFPSGYVVTIIEGYEKAIMEFLGDISDEEEDAE